MSSELLQLSALWTVIQLNESLLDICKAQKKPWTRFSRRDSQVLGGLMVFKKCAAISRYCIFFPHKHKSAICKHLIWPSKYIDYCRKEIRKTKQYKSDYLWQDYHFKEATACLLCRSFGSILDFVTVNHRFCEIPPFFTVFVFRKEITGNHGFEKMTPRFLPWKITLFCGA